LGVLLNFVNQNKNKTKELTGAIYQSKWVDDLHSGLMTYMDMIGALIQLIIFIDNF